MTDNCVTKVSGMPVSADRPRVKVDAVSTSDTVKAPNMVSRNTKSTSRPTGPCALKPVTASTIEDRLRPLFLRTWK